MDELSRQEALGIPASALNRKVIVLGAGGLGSPAVLGLTKTGFEDITVIDYDVVEEHNVGSQMYGPEDVGEYKADALINKAMSYMGKGQTLMAVRDKVRMPGDMQKHLKNADILVLAVDNNEARLSAVSAAYNERKGGGKTRFVVDARLNGFHSTVYSVDLDDEKEREEYFDSLEFTDGLTHACVQPATFCMGMMASGRMVLETLKRALQTEGISVTPKFNTWEDAYNNIVTTEQELFK